MKIVTCETVRRAFGDFQCCSSCHHDCEEGFDSPLDDLPYSVCCGGQLLLRANSVDQYDDEITNPALLKALENHE